ncbi:MAG: ATP-binding cassette domain-containing protein, partial [Acidimicrobiales bacterium]
MSTDAPIETQNLVRRFGDLEAVAGVDLRVETGEVFGFLGPNGAGKTTIVRMLTTLLRPTSGMAFVGGMDVVTQASAVRRTIGVALQDASVDPTLTGRELVRLQATLYG